MFTKRLSFIREPSLIALQTLRAHKLRSFLTLIGIILSVLTLVAVIALITGMNIYVEERVANLGSNVFLVHQFPLITDLQEFVKAQRRNKKITWEDFESMRDNLKLAKAVGVEVRTRGKLRAGTETLEDIDIRGVTANIGEMDVEEPAVGRYITDFDNDHRTMVTMIGDEIARRLFKNSDPMGQTLYIDGRPYEVVGVAKAMGSAFGQSQDAFAYIPVQSFFKGYGTFRSLSVNVQAKGPEVMQQSQEEARVLMRARRHLQPNEEDTFGILGSEALMNLWKNLTGAIASSMVGIVSVFMVIGGIVIMNVMLAAVTERTREIGVRKSLGATRRDILLQFLVEAAVMTGMGGVVGVAGAYLLAIIVRNSTPMPMVVPFSAVVLAVTISTMIGIFFGVYPARKAARLDPIEALRFEI